MKRKWISLIALFFLLSGCIPVEDTTEVGGEIAETATLPESANLQIETAAPTDAKLAPTLAATPTKSTPAPVETATPTES